jgi:hypothetical protein
MTVDAFREAVENAIASREMKNWEIVDLRSLVRFAERRGEVQNLDLILLRQSGTESERETPAPKAQYDPAFAERAALLQLLKEAAEDELAKRSAKHS